MMKPFATFAISLCLIAGLTATSFGQTTTPATPPVTPPATDATTPPATPPVAGDAAAATDLAMGAEDTSAGLPDPANAVVGKAYLAASFGQWEQRCMKTADGADPCQLYQLLKDKDGNSVAEISMFDLPAGAQAVAGASVMVPLETLLTANLRIAVDKGNPKIYPYTFCTTQGCVARIGFTADELAGLKKGGAGVMTIVPAVAPDKTVDLAMSLDKFTAGFEAMKTANTKVK